MKHKIRITERDLHNIIAESVKRILDEASYDYYSKASNKAKKSINGFSGEMMKNFNPKKFQKRMRQAYDLDNMADWTKDRPDDVWELFAHESFGRGNEQTMDSIKNKRTGEVRNYENNGYGACSERVRGQIVAGPEVDVSSDYIKMLNIWLRRK